MNAFQTCINTSDAVPLYLPKQLYLKPIAKINVSIQLPNIKKLGKSVSHWEIMEKLRELVRPDEFTLLKVSKTTIEFVRFEAEVELKSKLDRVITKLDNKMIKLKNFSDHLMRVRAAQSKSHFPTRHTWDAFFRDAKDMNEMKPGERPDTLHISNVPSKWFLPYHLERDTDNLPSERIFFRIFEKFGHIRNVDIPICDPDRAKMKEHISGLKTTTFEDKEFFEGYVQFKDYIGFTKCMEALKDMKLLRKEDGESVAVNIKVDFDRSKHLSDASIRRREIVRERLVKKRREKEEKDKGKIEEKQKQENAERQMEVNQKQEKETRRRLREEKRKARILEQLKISGSEEINEKIAKEERKLLKAQRKLESIRLVEELFRRIKERKEKDGSKKSSSYDSKTNKSNSELRAYKEQSEMAVFNQKETLHNAVKGRLMLKSVLKGSTRRDYSSSSDDEPKNNRNGNMENNRDRRQEGMDRNPNQLMPPPLKGYDPMWYGYPPPEAYTYAAVPPPNLYQALTPHPAYNMMYSQQRGRGGYRGNYPRRSRGYNNNYRGGYRGPKIPPELEDEYIKYFAKFLVEHKNEHDDRGRRSYDHSSSSHSRSRRSRSRSYDRDRRSRSRDRSRERSHERSRTRGRSCERSRTRERSRSRTRDRSRGRSRERSRDYSRNKTRDRSRDRSDARDKSRQKSRSRTKSPDRRRSTSSKKRTRSKSRSPYKNKSSRRSRSKTAFTPEKRTELYSRENSRHKSVDSSKFISPKSLRKQRSRSKSWSLPKESETINRSWSKSPKKVAN